MIKINSLTSSFPGMTQSTLAGSVEGALNPSGGTSPALFTRTCMASMTGDYLFEVGAGSLDSVRHTRLLMQYASDVGTPISEIAEQYTSLLSTLGYSQEGFRRIIAGVIGAADKPARYNSVPSVTPTYIHKLVLGSIPESTPEVMAHMVSDFVCHMLRPFGWITKDAPYVYRVRRIGLFPGYRELVDVMVAKDLQRVIQVLADADLSVVKAAMDRKSSIMPAMISQHLANAVVTAYELSRGSYDPESIVRSVLTLVLRVVLPDTPKEIAPRERVANHPVMSELRSNLAIFLAAQNMIATGVEPSVDFSDEEMTSVVLPHFATALAEVSPYMVRLLDDVTSHIGKQSTRTHMGVPGHVFIYENWDFSVDVPAFVRIRQTATGPQSYLNVQTPVSAALSSAMKPIKTALSVSDLVARRISMYELSAASGRVPGTGTEVVLGMPSITEFEIENDISMATLEPALLFNEDDVLRIGESGPIAISIKRLRYDYVALLTHLAVSKSSNVMVSSASTPLGSVPFISWRVRTDFSTPLGESAVVLGEVTSSEPLEVLTYIDDFLPSSAREGKTVPIADFGHAIHLWDWRTVSEQLGGFDPVYPVNIRNKTYTAEVNSFEMLNLGLRRKNVRFMRPVVASAVARLWFNWLVQDRVYLQEAIAGTEDTLMKEAFRGRQMTDAMQLVSLLTRIGASGAGANASRLVSQRIAQQMYKAGNIDDYSQIHVGIQRHRLNVWAGLNTLQLLRLISSSDATDLIAYLAASNALAMVVGSYEMNE